MGSGGKGISGWDEGVGKNNEERETKLRKRNMNSKIEKICGRVECKRKYSRKGRI